MLARAVIVPFAVALDDRQQLLGGLGPLAHGVERGRQIESRLMIERVRGDLLFELSHRPKRTRLFGEIDRGLHGLHRRVDALGFRHHGQGVLGLLDRAGREVAFREPRKRCDVGGIDRERFGIDLRCGRGVALGQHGVRLLRISAIFGSPAAGTPLVSFSMKALTWLSGTAPMKPSAGCPLTKAITAGID